MYGRWTFALLGLTLAALSVAQALPTKRTFSAGAETIYKLRMELTLYGDQAVYTSTVTEKTREPGPNALIDLVSKDYKAMIFGEEVSLNEADLPKIAHRVGEDGVVKEIVGDITLPASYRLATLRSIALPTSAVEPGGKYTASGKANKDKGLEDWTSEYVYEAAEELNGAKVGRLTVNFKETSGVAMATAAGKAWIDLATGQIVKLELDLTNAPIPGAPDPVNGKLLYEKA